MVQSFFKRLSFPLILFIFLVFISLNCFTFFLLNNSDYYTSYLTEEDPSFSLSSLPSIPKTGIHFRVAHDSSSSREDTFLLLRFLFPSDSLLNFWRYNELSKPDLSPLVHPAQLKILSPMEEESFRAKINFCCTQC